MINQSETEDFLRNYGGVNVNDLTKFLNSDDEILTNPTTIIVSNHHGIEDLTNNSMLKTDLNFKILSFNVKSLASKIDNIKIFVELLKN